MPYKLENQAGTTSSPACVMVRGRSQQRASRTTSLEMQVTPSTQLYRLFWKSLLPKHQTMRGSTPRRCGMCVIRGCTCSRLWRYSFCASGHVSLQCRAVPCSQLLFRHFYGGGLCESRGPGLNLRGKLDALCLMPMLALADLLGEAGVILQPSFASSSRPRPQSFMNQDSIGQVSKPSDIHQNTPCSSWFTHNAGWKLLRVTRLFPQACNGVGEGLRLTTRLRYYASALACKTARATFLCARSWLQYS
jgi:hypothetical protein